MEFGAEIDGSEDFFQVNKHLLLSGIYQDKTITLSIDIVSHATGGVFARQDHFVGELPPKRTIKQNIFIRYNHMLIEGR